MSLFTAMKRVFWKQIPWVIKIHKDGEAFRKLTNFGTLKYQETFICGAKIKDRNGKVITFFCRQKFLSANKKGNPILSFIEAEDITAIFKGDIGWCRMIDYAFDIPIKRVFFANGTKEVSNELLSYRELQILKLVMENKDSSTIANQLSISQETVKKHRKNMIAKTGAKDMTALIYLCQQSNVI